MSSRTKSFKVPFWAQIIAGLVLGVLLGWLARSQDLSWLVTSLEKVGDTFIGLLKLAVAPLVFFAILVSITNLRKVNNAARLASRTLLWFMATSLIAVSIGLVIGLVTNPGAQKMPRGSQKVEVFYSPGGETAHTLIKSLSEGA